jgi:SnoaL-like polyketide cyclase
MLRPRYARRRACHGWQPSWGLSGRRPATTMNPWTRTTPDATKSGRITMVCWRRCGLHLDVRQRHPSVRAIVVEVIVRGQHLGPWRGLPATGSRIEIPLCGIFTFDNEDRVAGEKIYYDRATLLRQLGLFHEPESVVGRIGTMLMHPLTMAHVAARMFWKQD